MIVIACAVNFYVIIMEGSVYRAIIRHCSEWTKVDEAEEKRFSSRNRARNQADRQLA